LTVASQALARASECLFLGVVGKSMLVVLFVNLILNL
jgi:hypothetical protein